MTNGLAKTLVAAAIALTIAAATAAIPDAALAHSAWTHSGLHHRGGFIQSRWHDPYAQAYARGWRPMGWGCGPFGDNEDGWDIGWSNVCYYPYYGGSNL